MNSNGIEQSTDKFFLYVERLSFYGGLLTCAAAFIYIIIPALRAIY